MLDKLVWRQKQIIWIKYPWWSMIFRKFLLLWLNKSIVINPDPIVLNICLDLPFMQQFIQPFILLETLEQLFLYNLFYFRKLRFNQYAKKGIILTFDRMFLLYSDLYFSSLLLQLLFIFVVSFPYYSEESQKKDYGVNNI